MKNRVAIVTGGSRGIGRAVCLQLAKEQLQVVINYSSSRKEAEALLEQIKEAGGDAVLYKADVSDSRQVNEMVQFAVDTLGGLDVLVNNAGVMKDSLVEEITNEEWDQVLRTNLNSVFYACRAAIPHFKSRNYGRIINISSQAALTGSVRHSHYAASKSAMLGFTYSLAKELGPYGITANIVSPGRIVTDMISSRGEGRLKEWLSQTPLGRLGEPEEVAHAVSYLISEQAGYITGHNLHVNGGLVMR